MTNTLPIREPNMMMKYAIVLKTCSVGESGSYEHCGDAGRDPELEFVKLSLVFVVIFGEESSIDKKKVRRISKIVVLYCFMFNSYFGGTTGASRTKVKYFLLFP